MFEKSVSDRNSHPGDVHIRIWKCQWNWLQHCTTETVWINCWNLFVVSHKVILYNITTLTLVLLQPCWVILHWNSSFQMWVQWSTCKTVPLEEEFLSYLHVATATTHYVHNTEKWFLTGKNGYFHSSASVCCPSISSQTGQTALMAASFTGHLPIVERLLAAEAQPDLRMKVQLIQWGWEVGQSTNPLGID